MVGLMLDLFGNSSTLYFYKRLMFCITERNSVGLLDLINQASPEVFNQALLINNNDNDTPLSLSAYCQHSDAFQALIAKASHDAINEALLRKNCYNCTPLTLAAQ